ncbi:DUF2141 domain-containing protein [Geomesophilobacter sediminis]|nr:DUF2141 domain-containing protein [Geomesophilobacter sediminis]
MNESTARKPPVASSATNLRLRSLAGFLRVASVVMSLLVWEPCHALAGSECRGIHVRVLDIRNSKGTVACALFEAPAGFPAEFLKTARNIMVIKIRESQARCDFLDIPPGKYAVAVIHDENRNGKLDTNLFGVPKEGYGFSNDAKGVIGAPTFSAASFSYDGKDLDLTISLHY